MAGQDSGNTTQPPAGTDAAVVKFNGRKQGPLEQLVRSVIVGEPQTEQRLMLTLAISLDLANVRLELLTAADYEFDRRVAEAVRSQTQRGSLR